MKYSSKDREVDKKSQEGCRCSEYTSFMDYLSRSTPSITLLLSQLGELLADRRHLERWICFSVSHDQDQHSPLVQAGTCVLSSAEELLRASQTAPEVPWPSAASPPGLFGRSVQGNWHHWFTLCAITLLLVWHKLHAQ